MTNARRGVPTPAKLLLLTASAIFFGEVIVMFVLAVIPPISVVTEAFLDGTMITCLMAPFLYLLLYKPMAAEIDRRRTAEEDVRDLNRDLEKRVEQRTEELLEANVRLRREISEKREARDEIWKDHEFIRSVVEAAPCLFVIYDVGARRCVFANSLVENFLGYATEEIFDSDQDFFREVLSSEDYSKLTEGFLGPLDQASSAKDLGTIRMRQRSGEWKRMSARYAVLRSHPQGETSEILFAAIEGGD